MTNNNTATESNDKLECVLCEEKNVPADYKTDEPVCRHCCEHSEDCN